jgi:hypothetical protein
MHIKKRKWTQLAQEKNLLQNILNTVTNIRIAKSSDNFWLAFSLQLRVVIDYAFSLSPHLYPVYENYLVATALWVSLF